MKRDIWVMSSGILAIGIAVWAVWGNPETTPRRHAFQETRAASENHYIRAGH